MDALVAAHQVTLYNLIFFGSFATVALLEHYRPRRELRASIRTRWLNNFSLNIVNWALFLVVFPTVALGSSLLAAQYEWGLLHHVTLPTSLEALIAVLLLDLGHYLIHYLFHRVPLLWRMHRLHHTDQDFDLSTAVRFHPSEAVIEHAANLGVIVLVGPPAWLVALFVLMYILTTFWVHGNFRLPGGWDAKLRWFMVTPDMHRCHHSQDERETNSNYGGLLSCWDRIFGTYTDEPALGHEHMKIGIKEFHDKRHLRLGWMLWNPVMPGDSEPIICDDVRGVTTEVP